MTASPELLRPATTGWSHPRLPVLLYRAALPGDTDAAEDLFRRHGWFPEWRNGIFRYDHHHSTAHEVLGVLQGRAMVRIGGPEGEQVCLSRGDAVVLPAGTGHCLIEASDGFQVFGAYLPGQDWDICRAPADAETRRRIERVTVPDRDPFGSSLAGETWRLDEQS
ncbi:cupin domain-containing protein [Cereibacter azotoformans]|uniref:Cupin type-2 domain-containing protein n=1 Tax=Cereibacter sphaeroides (strain ATCC 17025 / ATH 2.4.3) TaxID=349102 RepID=A4WYF3_CERS5|nr:cupin domain-containing protein [Cereibacter azotoformans]ULB11875.1 cupin domain-containing protein [Cereibacter azotoformans]